MKYIDADLLRKEIDKWEEAIEDDNSNYSNRMRFTLRHFTFLLDSLQQEQSDVDLDKEITKWIDSGDITDTRFDDYDDSDIERTARHFYELGLNARKEESK